MKQPAEEIQLSISSDDAGLLMIALWERTHDAANPGDYAYLRSRLHEQLCAQGYDAGTQRQHEVTQ
jgi:hypothetical protein